MNVFVTGATGLIGAHLTEALLLAGHQVVCLVRDGVPAGYFHQKRLSERCIVVRGDIQDAPLLARALTEYEIESVYHLAAQTIVRYGSQSPVGTFEANVRGTWNLLEACRSYPKVKRVVVASSDKAYGDQPLPYSEGMRLAGKYPYDVSKSCADLIAQSYYHTYTLPVSIVRCSNVYGAGDVNWSRIVPRTFRRGIKRDVDLVLRGGGAMQRDYLHVSDAVSGYFAVHDNGACGEAYNFGTGQPIALHYAVEMIFERLGLQPDFVSAHGSDIEIYHQWMDKTKARKYLKWQPSVTFEGGIDLSIPWYREFLKTA